MVHNKDDKVERETFKTKRNEKKEGGRGNSCEGGGVQNMDIQTIFSSALSARGVCFFILTSSLRVGYDDRPELRVQEPAELQPAGQHGVLPLHQGDQCADRGVYSA